MRGGRLKFRFRGKSGIRHDIELTDARLAAIVRRMQDLPGQELFQYVDETGERRPIESADVNAYLKQAAGAEFTSKDFRTWSGTVLAARALAQTRDVKQAIERVAKQLGNTQAVCRKCYVHPAIVECYADGTLLEALPDAANGPRRRPVALDPCEAAVLRVLRAWSKRARDLRPLLARSLSARRLQKRDTTPSAFRGATP